jgi:biopolymer transport protein ExbD
MVNNLEMTLPSGKPPPPNPNMPKPKVNRIVVDEKGQVFLNDEFVPTNAIKERLQALKAKEPEPIVVVKGADDVDYQSMIIVLDALQQLDITKVGLATE